MIPILMVNFRRRMRTNDYAGMLSTFTEIGAEKFSQ